MKGQLLTLLLLSVLLLAACSPSLNTGNLSLTPRLAAETLQTGVTTRGDAFKAFGSPNSISYTEQTPWQYQSQRYLYPVGTREIWSYFSASIDGMDPLSNFRITNHRQVVRVYFDEHGVLTNWDVRPISN